MQTSTPSDPFTVYEVGIDRLLDFLGGDHSDVSEVLVFQQRLLENIAAARQYGDTETLRHERARIIDQLNALARAVDGPLLPVVRSRPRAITTEQRNRSRMLEKVQITWIKGVLEKSLHNEVLIALNMEERPNAVARPWDMVLREHDQNRTLPPDTKIIDVFDQVGGELLILGAPGSGKTTMLLELTRDLIARAEQDDSQPMPIVFNLSSWAEKRKPLAEWLVDELNTKYDVPRKIGKGWIVADQVLPLLDGLDEVKQDHRKVCVEAINAFRRDHGLVSLVVCSRVAEYDALAARFKLQEAILVQPLTSGQIDAYLTHLGLELSALRTMLQRDAALQELAETPLMLSLLTLVYRGANADALASDGSVEEQRKRLFDTYLERMFVRRGMDARYSQEQTVEWLVWLARTMREQMVSVFLIERLQPSWLTSRAQRLAYELLIWILLSTIGSVWILSGMFPLFEFEQDFIIVQMLIVSLLTGFCFSLLWRLTSSLTHYLLARLPQNHVRSAATLAGFISTGLVIVLLWGRINAVAWIVIMLAVLRLLCGPVDHIKLIEIMRWSWTKATRGLVLPLVSLPLGILAMWLTIGLTVWLQLGQSTSLIEELSTIRDSYQDLFHFSALLPVLLLLSILMAIAEGTQTTEIGRSTIPNQGMRRSSRNAILSFLFGGALTALISGVAFAFFFTMSGEGLVNAGFLIESIIFFGVPVGLIVGFFASMSRGGFSLIQHYSLCLVLWHNNAMPWNYARFLDYCADRIFLRKVGGGYIFIHRMLMEYFASLDTSKPSEEVSARKE